jgi:glycosyltransferase involved in cell wall biosynthesis
MFIIACKYHSMCRIEETVKSIRQLYPSTKILVVDSASDDKSYVEKLKKYDIIFADINNVNYESGAFWYATKQYKEDWYVLLQDSVILKKDLNDLIESEKLFYCFINFFENSMSNHMRTESLPFINRINEMLGDFVKLSIDSNTFYCGVFGPNFFIKRKMVDMMLDKNLDKSLKPANKYDQQLSERVYGLVAKQCGVNVLENTLDGNLHDLMNRCLDVSTETIHTEHISKTWLNKYRK